MIEESEHVESCSSTTKKHYVSITTMPLATKLGMVVIYHKGFPPIKLHVSLISWSREIT